MAQNKLPKKPVTKRSVKPEEVLVAKPKLKLKAKPKPVKKRRIAKKPKHKLYIKKYAAIRVRQPIFKLIVASVVCIAVVITWIFVSNSLRETNKSLNESAKAANGMFIAAKAEADLVRIIGTRTQRASEIVNYQSAPNDLQKFAMDDYKLFKKQCIANGKLSDDISYVLNNVVYDAYAVAKRTCNGTDSAIFKKFEGRWAVVFSGNILPQCSLVNDLSIPQGASMYCEQNGITYVNPNP